MLLRKSQDVRYKNSYNTDMKETIIFAGGCFWCTEAVFSELKGVLSVMPGYAGGQKSNPTYGEVCTGMTGHAEVTRVEYDPAQILFSDLLTVFFATHDPTTLNRQGNDVGTQYGSAIFYTTDAQKKESEDFIAELNKEGEKVVTELKPLDVFYPAENYHQNYFKNNPDKPYCQVVISPKLEKLKDKFYNLLKK